MPFNKKGQVSGEYLAISVIVLVALALTVLLTSQSQVTSSLNQTNGSYLSPFSDTSGSTSDSTTTPANCTRTAPEILISPTTKDGSPGKAVAYQVFVYNKDSPECKLSAFSLSYEIPQGWTASFSPSSLTVESGGFQESTFLIASSENATATSYSIAITATHSSDNSLTGKSSAIYYIGNLTVESFDFAIYLNPNSASIIQGNNTEVNIAISLIGAVSKEVNLSIEGCPPFVTCAISPEKRNVPFDSMLTIETTNSTPIGTHTIKIIGNGEGKTRDALFTLNINPLVTIANDTFAYSLSVNPSSLTVLKGYSANATVTATLLSQQKQKVILYTHNPLWGPLPAGYPTPLVSSGCGEIYAKCFFAGGYSTYSGYYSTAMDGYPTFSGTFVFAPTDLTPPGTYTIYAFSSNMSTGDPKPKKIPITITVVDSNCARVPPSASIIPLLQYGNPGETLLYTFTITNRDSVECNPSIFDLFFSSTTKYSSDYKNTYHVAVSSNTNQLAIDPGTSKTAILSVTSPANYSPSIAYTFSTSAKNRNPPWYSNLSSSKYAITGSGYVLPQCSDAIDNDGDGKIDYPNDPGCGSILDSTE